MSDAPRVPDAPEIPEAVVATKRRRAPQLVWVIPIVAALIGGWLAVKTILERGPTITISFKTGEGLEAGKTQIKYKDVDIGLVKSVALAKDRTGVVATAELSKEAEAFLAEDTRFWVVRPRVSGGSVTGLGTLLGGSYIGVDVGTSEKRRREFTGLDAPPVVALDVPGRQFVLRAEDLGSLDVGAPIYFRRVQAGQVVAFELDKEGKGVTLKIFVYAPYDQYVTANTRFWHASGIDFSLDATGFKVDTQSVIAILVGGIEFQTPPDSGPVPAADNDTVFRLYANRTVAFKHPDVISETYVVVFKDSVRGLSVGAPVDFRGIVVGEVTAINVDFDPVKKEFTMPVEVLFYPDRLRSRLLKGSADPRKVAVNARERLDGFVEHGLRAQLRTGNLLIGQLYVALDFFPDTPKAKVDWTKSPPEVPTVAGGFEELQATLTQIAKTLEKVPFDAVATDLRQVLQGVNRTLKEVTPGARGALEEVRRTLQSADQLVKRLDQEIAPEARSALTEARRTLGVAERTLAADAPLQQDMRETLRELARAAQALRVLADYLERHPEALVRGKNQDLP
jgi:paraquat-inducible protein B